MRSCNLSIIVPVYNVENYLPACLDSIVNQSYTDWECVLVDDGSTDSSGAICDSYAQIDSRFRVFHKTNGGVSSARNEGLKYATGEWICFSDSDDEFLPEAFSTMIAKCSDKYNHILFEYVCEIEGRCIPVNVPIAMGKVDSDYLIDQMLCYKVLGGPFSRLYHRDNLLGVFFPSDLKIGEDLLFNIRYILNLGKSPSIIKCNDKVYKYKIRSNSAMGLAKAAEYTKLTQVVSTYLNAINSEKYKNHLAVFEIINILAPCLAKYTCPSKDSRKRILELYPQCKEELYDSYASYVKYIKLGKIATLYYILYKRIYNLLSKLTYHIRHRN